MSSGILDADLDWREMQVVGDIDQLQATKSAIFEHMDAGRGYGLVGFDFQGQCALLRTMLINYYVKAAC
jgi:hypothetical protein